MSENIMVTDVGQVISEMGAGNFEKKLSRAISDVAAAVVDCNKSGKVIMQLDMKRIGESQQVNIKHKVSYVRPTLTGKYSEEDATETPMYVSNAGKVSLFPENQTQMFTMTGDVNTSKEGA